MPLTLPDAIQHAMEQVGDASDCSDEHLQLAKWLQELLVYRQQAEHRDDGQGDLDPERLLATIEEEELLLADGFEGACIGISRQFNRAMIAYDRATCIRILMAKGPMTRVEAEGYFDFNVSGSWVGEKTPAFIEFLRPPIR